MQTMTKHFDLEIERVKEKSESLVKLIRAETEPVNGLTESIAVLVQMNQYLACLISAKETYCKHTALMAQTEREN